MFGVKGIKVQAGVRWFSSQGSGVVEPGRAVAEKIHVAAVPRTVAAGARRTQCRKSRINAIDIKELVRKRSDEVRKLRSAVRTMEDNLNEVNRDSRFGIISICLLCFSSICYLDQKLNISMHRRGY
jgi:hypothetical protein